MAGDFLISKAGWIKFKEVLSPRGKVAKGVQIKYKTWKDVWLTLRKSGNSNSLKVFSDSVKASSFTTEGYTLCYEDMCGFEIGEFDGLLHVLAIVTRHVTYLIAPSDKKEKDEWTEKISQLFEEQSLFYVTIKKNCPIREGPAELRLLSTSVILTGDQPPVCLGKWLISDIRRYGTAKDFMFVFEVSHRCEEDKKPIFKLATSEANVIKKQIDEMARSSSVVGQITRQSVEKTKSFPSSQKTTLSATKTAPHQFDSDFADGPPYISNEKTLTYADVEFSTPPSKSVYQSPLTSNYVLIDITATEALSQAVKQNEDDKKSHAKELAKKLGPRYENNVMWTTQLGKLSGEMDGDGEDKNFRRATDIPTKQTEEILYPRRTSTDILNKSDFRLSGEHSRPNYENHILPEIPHPSGEYENVNIGGNYENIVFTSCEQDRGLNSN